MHWLCAFFTWLRSDPNNITAVSTVAIAAFTLVLAAVGYSQARLIRKSIDLARQEFVASHRPMIVLRDVSLEGTKILYMLANVGGTQATIVESWVVAERVTEGSPIRPLRPAGHDDLGRLVLIGGETRDLTLDIPSDMGIAVMYPSSRRLSVDGRPPELAERYFTGAIVYCDDFGVRRRSVFRRRWDDANGFVRLANERDQEYAD